MKVLLKKAAVLMCLLAMIVFLHSCGDSENSNEIDQNPGSGDNTDPGNDPPGNDPPGNGGNEEPDPMGTLFTDGFESGDLSFSENDVNYGDATGVSVTDTVSYSGDYSLQFRFHGNAMGGDAWAEQRMTYPQQQELWIKFNLYIPSNYHHRMDPPANNKFLAVYRTPYREPTFMINWSTRPNDSGGSDLELHRYRREGDQSRELAVMATPEGIGFIGAADLGKWMEIVARIVAPSSADTNDGIMQMWKNGLLVTDETELNNYGGDGTNFMDELYLLGWANSGFDEDTYLYIDNVQLSDSSLLAE